MTIINAYIKTCDSGDISNGYIKTENGRFSEIGRMKDYGPEQAGDQEIIDLMGKTVYPGFIDAHTHIGMWDDGLGFEGDDANEISDPATPHLRSIDAVNGYDRCFEEAVAAGITTVVTGPGSANPISGQAMCLKTYTGRVDKRVVKSPVAMKLALGENPKTSYNDRDETPKTRMATAAIIREYLLRARRYSAEIERAENESEYPDYDIKLEALLPVIKGELPVHIHAHRRDDIFTAVRIAEEFDLDYVIVHATEGHMCARELADCGATILSGPIICDRSKPELKNLTPSSPGILVNNKVKTCLISDHPVIPIQYLPICAGLAVREGMSYEDALLSITVSPAEILGIQSRVGSISVGKDADFSVFSSDPLTLNAKPDMVFIEGICRFKNNN